MSNYASHLKETPGFPWRCFLKTSYYLVAMIAFATLVNDVLVLRWHNWEGHLFNFIPYGAAIGWFEVALFSALAAYSLILAIKEILSSFQLSL